MIELFNEDNMVGMARYPDKYFELAIVDPPYGIGASMNPNRATFNCKEWKNRNENIELYIPKEWDKEKPSQEYFNELSRISENQIIWGGNHFSLPISASWIVWDKKAPKGFSSSEAELAWVSNGGSIRIFSYLWHGYKKEFPEKRQHPTQKPVKLYEWLLKNYAKQGDKILDTHGGSMSSAIACYNLDFDLTLFEIDKDYFEAGKARLEEHKKQGRLYDK